jgi:hypothetical protein
MPRILMSPRNGKHEAEVFSYTSSGLILLDACPHSTRYVYSYHYVCVLMRVDILLDTSPHHTIRYVSVVILLDACRHITRYVSAYHYVCVHTG